MRREISMAMCGTLRITQDEGGGPFRIEQLLMGEWKPIALAEFWDEAHFAMHDFQRELVGGQFERRTGIDKQALRRVGS